MAGSKVTIFEELTKEAEAAGHSDVRTTRARTWLRERARDVNEVSDEELIDDKEHQLTPIPHIGGMFLFKYDPKLRDKLPYYDAYPLVIITEFTSDGFKGMNMHYLPPAHRAALMDRLYSLATNTRIDDTTRINASYALLAGLSSFSFFRPCYKRYLFSQCESRFLLIHPKHWEIALFLPLERFQKASATRIYNESLGQLRPKRRRLH